ncbi:hypothetical protein [Microcystis phage Mel-JY01]
MNEQEYSNKEYEYMRSKCTPALSLGIVTLHDSNGKLYDYYSDDIDFKIIDKEYNSPILENILYATIWDDLISRDKFINFMVGNSYGKKFEDKNNKFIMKIDIGVLRSKQKIKICFKYIVVGKSVDTFTGIRFYHDMTHIFPLSMKLFYLSTDAFIKCVKDSQYHA